MGAVHLPQKKKYTRVIGDAVVMSQAEAIVFEAMRNLRLDGTVLMVLHDFSEGLRFKHFEVLDIV